MFALLFFRGEKADHEIDSVDTMRSKAHTEPPKRTTKHYEFTQILKTNTKKAVTVDSPINNYVKLLSLSSLDARLRLEVFLHTPSPHKTSN